MHYIFGIFRPLQPNNVCQKASAMVMHFEMIGTLRKGPPFHGSRSYRVTKIHQIAECKLPNGRSIKLQGDNLINMLLSAEDMRNSPNCRMQAAKWVGGLLSYREIT